MIIQKRHIHCSDTFVANQVDTSYQELKVCFILQSYETAFKQIKEAIEIEDLQLLVGKFIETEDKNFALFNYVNELNNNIDFLQEQIADIENNINQFKQETIEMDDKRQKILKNMEVNFIPFPILPKILRK